MIQYRLDDCVMDTSKLAHVLTCIVDKLMETETYLSIGVISVNIESHTSCMHTISHKLSVYIKCHFQACLPVIYLYVSNNTFDFVNFSVINTCSQEVS